MIVVIPMAGRGSRFADRGYQIPKPLIEVSGVPMVIRALKSLEGLSISRIIFVLLEEHEHQYGVKKLLEPQIDVPTTFITIPDVTEGQLCTVLEAKKWIDTDEDVLIAASDTYVKSDIAADIQALPFSAAGIISVADLPGDRWSFARVDDSRKVVEVAEKVRISNHASTGLYYFSKGKDLVKLGEHIISVGERAKGEFYVIPVYQKMIEQGGYVGISQAIEMWDMGTPEAKEAYEIELLKH